jgi:hypothetical protein
VIWRLYCRIGDVHLGEIHADQRPLRGDLIGYSPPEWSPFKGQFHWRVDEVVWQVATPGSVWVRDRIRSGEITDPGSGHVTADIDVLVWPEQGPFWRGDTPGWARWFVEDEVAEHD